MQTPPKADVLPLPPPQHEFCQLEVERSIIAAFRKEAIARETTVPRFIRNLLDVIVTDRPTHAILDDQPAVD